MQERKRMAEMAHYVCEVELVCEEGAELSVGSKGICKHLRVPSTALVPGGY